MLENPALFKFLQTIGLIAGLIVLLASLMLGALGFFGMYQVPIAGERLLAIVVVLVGSLPFGVVSAIMLLLPIQREKIR